MIAKQLSFNGKFGDLIDYILRGAAHSEDFTIFRNTEIGTDRDSVVRSFIENDKYRKRVRTRAQHIILSFHHKSNPSPEALLSLTNEFLRLRRMDKSVVFGKCHAEPSSGCVHIHLAVSQNLYLQDKSVRVSKKEYMDQNRALEHFQEHHFPELSDSIAYLKERKKKREKPLSAKKSQRAKLREIVNNLADKAEHLQDLHKLLDRHPEIEPYSRNDTKYYGVYWKGKHKSRLKSLITRERYSSLVRLELMREVMERSERENEKEQSLTL